jgi:hypothetical protein
LDYTGKGMDMLNDEQRGELVVLARVVGASPPYQKGFAQQDLTAYVESLLAAERVATKLQLCPDGCYRPKARNADDCAVGCCSKWYAVRDDEAQSDCEKLAAFWKGVSNG